MPVVSVSVTVFALTLPVNVAPVLSVTVRSPPAATDATLIVPVPASRVRF